MKIECRYGDVISTIAEPHAFDLQPLLSPRRTCLQVTGPGGIGKTTLAAALARWALDGSLLGHTALPLAFDGPIDKLTDAILESLSGLLDGVEVDLYFVKALLRTRRIVLIFDRVSEQLPQTQDTVRKVFTKLPCTLCIFTLREALALDGASVAELRPEPIRSAATLAYFMEREIVRFDKKQLYPTLSSRAALISELAKSLDLESESIITPLLVTMYVELVFKKHETQREPDSIVHGTTTELYLDYFHSVFSSRIKIAYDDAIVIGGQLGKLAVKDAFVPSPFLSIDAKAAITASGSVPADAVLDALKSAGLLRERNEGRLGRTQLQFTIDMLAEVLGGYQLIVENDDSDEWFEAIKYEIQMKHSGAEGFVKVLQMIRAAIRSAIRLNPTTTQHRLRSG